MSDSQLQNIQSNTADVLPDPTAGTGPGIKPVDIDAPYEHAPPKDGDPWTTLLTPELEADTLRCNAWKDEVQNLLIFAGLFSAVVTTFIVESYKLLLPDPNAAMTGLLFHIASGLNNTSPFPPSVSPESILAPFSRTPIAVRINVFWFISLILSLTTVLVGTIALQWLREHQFYGGYSSKEKLAMLHMRSEAIEAWYLPQIFAALPLLLQGALVLFLAGLIDFSLPLGMKLTIPVSVIVGLTLLFLAATTILPSLQGLSFFCGLYPRKSLPTPCPFKSPQSHAFRTLFGIVVRAIFRIVPSPRLNQDRNDWKWTIKNHSSLIADYLVPSVYKMWYPHTWPSLDRAWISLRDVCHQHILDKDPDLYQHLSWRTDDFPLSDATQYLVKMVRQPPGFKHTDSYLAAMVHCFNELAESIWAPTVEWFFERKDRRSNYFECLYLECSTSCSLSTLLLHGGIYKFDQLDHMDLFLYFQHPEVKLRLFSTDQTIIFLRKLLINHPSPAVLKYHQELWVRVLHLIHNIAPLKPTNTNGSQSIPIPAITEGSMLDTIINDNLTPGQQYLNAANILTTIFQLAASYHPSQNQTIESILAHPEMAKVLDTLASWTANYLRWAQIDPLTKQDVLRDIDDQLIQLAKFITDHLNARSNTSSSSENASLDLLFYLTLIFLWNLYWRAPREILGNQDSHIGKAFGSLLNALHKTWTSGQKNDLLEKQLKGDNNGFERFSDEWYNQIFKHLTGPRTIEQGSNSAAEGPPDVHPDPLTQSASPLENKTEDDINPLTATSPGIPDYSLASNTDDGDAPPASAHPDPQLEIFGPELALSSANHEDAHIPHPQPDSLTILHQPPTSAAEGAGTINVLPLSPIISSSDKPDETRPSNDGHTAAGAAPPLVPQPPASFSIADPEGPPQAAGSSRSDDQDLQPDGLHLAIDVGPPTSPEHVDAETLGAGGDRSLDEGEAEDAIVRMESPI